MQLGRDDRSRLKGAPRAQARRHQLAHPAQIPQHPPAIPEYPHVCGFSVEPFHRQIDDLQPQRRGEREHLDIETEAVQELAAKNFPRGLPPKGFEPALRVSPADRQPLHPYEPTEHLAQDAPPATLAAAAPGSPDGAGCR